jgi:hypothetical protein
MRQQVGLIVRLALAAMLPRSFSFQASPSGKTLDER